MRLKVFVVYAAVGVVWGSAWIPGGALAEKVPGLPAGALRFALAAAAIGLFTILFRLRKWKNTRRPGKVPLGSAVLLGVTMVGLPYALTLWAGQRVSPGLAPLFYGLMPLLVLLCEGDERGDAIPPVVLGIGGVAMVAAPGISLHAGQIPGLAALAAAVVLGSFSLMYVRRLFAGGRLRSGDLLPFAAIQFGVASVLLFVLALGSGQLRAFRREVTDGALPLAILAILVSGGTLPAVYWMLSRMPAWQVATLQWLTTLVAVFEAAVLVRARPAMEGWIGAVLIPACLVWILRRGILRSGGVQDAEPVTREITSDTFRRGGASDTPGDSG